MSTRCPALAAAVAALHIDDDEEDEDDVEGDLAFCSEDEARASINCFALSAPTATLLKRQKPWLGAFSALPSRPAWWPGGRITEKAVRYLHCKTSSTESSTVPTACKQMKETPK